MSEKVVEYDLKRGKCGIECKNSERVLFFRKGISAMRGAWKRRAANITNKFQDEFVQCCG